MNVTHVTDEFAKRMEKLCSGQEQKKIAAFKKRLALNAWLGDAVGPSWVREMRLDGKRVYFLVDEPVILFIAFSSKKDQQEVIDGIREELETWKRTLKVFRSV